MIFLRCEVKERCMTAELQQTAQWTGPSLPLMLITSNAQKGGHALEIASLRYIHRVLTVDLTNKPQEDTNKSTRDYIQYSTKQQ
jgi:hypothetical protein